jgi:5-methylcytosine-specific restriction protein A
MPRRIPSFRPTRLASCDSNRPNAAARGYCDSRHQRWRLAVLNRDNWQCRACGRICSGKGEAHADHIVPVGSCVDRYDLSNGQCLCSSCHSRKTALSRE